MLSSPSSIFAEDVCVAVQQRLSLAVEAEVEEAKDAHFRQYKRRTVAQLRRSGAD